MTRLSLIAIPLALVACVDAGPRPDPVPATPVVDACGAAELQDLVGQPDAIASDITFATPVRIIQPGTAVTMDFSAERLNIEVGIDGNITRIYCG